MVEEVSGPRKANLPRRGRGRRVATLAARMGASYGTNALVQRLRTKSPEATAVLHAKNATRVFEAAAALRGPFMKLVQLFATQTGLLPEQYVDALAPLQDQAPPLPWDEFRPALTRELGREPEKIFRWVQREPIAAASLGQVYAGMLHDGSHVAVKVQYPGIREAVDRDLRAFRRFLKAQRRLGLHTPLSQLNLDEMLSDLSDRLREETDYRREAANVELFRRIYRGWEWVHIPRVRFKYSTDRVLTMDLMTGAPLGDVLRAEGVSPERERLLVRLCRMFDYECYGAGVFHADPHPGNKLIAPDGSIHLLDFGCVKILPRRVRDALRASARALATNDVAANLEALRDLGLYRDGLDPGPALVWSRFMNRPLLAGENEDGAGDLHAVALYHQLGELTRHGYAQVAPHTFFLLRAFMGLDGIFRRLPSNGNGHGRAGERIIPLSEELISAGDRVREDLELDGYLRLR
jgi:predicted unusual protein kinase regulating ubiquinone biosynthesis (AarF/ABC1/UbiB family)